jgi:Methyltransferase domain
MLNSIKNIYRFLSPRFQTLHLDYPVNFKPRYGHGLPPHLQLYDIINSFRENYAEILRGMLKYQDAFFSIKKSDVETDTTQPAWNNGFLPALDIMAIYTLLAELKPTQYIEVGSGNSTKVAYKAIKEQNLPTKITSIDPYPRAEIDQLADTIIRKPFETIDYSFIKNLKPKDILFIDNSHRVLPNSDALVFFMEILPQLPVGVVVHIHDIYLPYDYPQFMCDRFYSEQYLLAAFIMANPQRYRPLLPNYFIYEDKDLHSILNPIWQNSVLQGVEMHGGSFWIEIT